MSNSDDYTYYHRSGKRLGVIYFPEKEMEYGFEWEGPKLADPTFPVLSDVLSTGYLGNFVTSPTSIIGNSPTEPKDLGTNPRACCGTLTKTFDVACAVNVDNTLGSDVHYKFELKKHCNLWPTLQINTAGGDFDVVTKVEFYGMNNQWNDLPQNTPNIWNKGDGDFSGIGTFPTGFAVNFRIQIDANINAATGNFKLEIAAIEQSNADPMVCADDFNSCCRIAVDTGGHIPVEYAQPKASSFDFKLVPNPATEQVTILFNNEMEEQINIELLDGLGKVHSKATANGKDATFDLRHLPAGLYGLRVSSQGNQKTKKLVLVK